MPAGNECIDWAQVRSQVGSGGLKWLTSDPGTGTLPDARVNTSAEVWSYVKTTTSNPYTSNLALTWNQIVAYRKLQVSAYAAHFSSPSVGLYAGNTTGYVGNGQPYTVECWVRPYTASVYGSFISLVQNNALSGVHFALGSGNVFTLNYAGASSLNPYSYTGANGVWVHLAVTSTGSVQKVYINGSQVATTTVTSYMGNGYELVVGKGEQQGGSIGYTGLIDIDEARAWGINRTQAEIQAGMVDVVPVNASGLFACFRFENDTSETTGARSISGNPPTSYVTDTGF